MIRKTRLRSLILGAALTLPLPALACHEAVITMGKGLSSQAYIAPNPAEVLILWTDASHDREFTGMELAGHRLTLVGDLDELEEFVQTGQYDIVITPLDLADSVGERLAGGTTKIVPVVSRDQRRSREVRDRFDQYLVDEAGVARFLSVINRAMAG